MENQNLNANKRYNKFRQARRKKDKSNTINVDEVSGRHYKLERFLRDCILHLPKHIQESENELSNAYSDANPTTSKTKRTKHVKLPVLNECKGLFENAIIGRSAKKVGEFGDIVTTPEDRARLHEDLHALAKVGPDSELSFELPPSPLPNRPSDEIRDPQEIQVTPVSPPVRVIDTPSRNALGRSWPEERSQGRHSKSLREQDEARSHEDVSDENRPNSVVNDSGFKDAGGSLHGCTLQNPSSFHCNCCRRYKPVENFFDGDAILKLNSPSESEPTTTPRIASPRLPSSGIASELIFGNRGDRHWLFEDSPDGPANSHGVTYRHVGYSPPFDFEGIEIQSTAPDFGLTELLGDVNVYTGRHRETPATPGMLKRSVPWSGVNRVTEVKRYNRRQNPTIPQSDSICLPHLSPYNKFRYNRSLSPRKY